MLQQRAPSHRGKQQIGSKSLQNSFLLLMESRNVSLFFLFSRDPASSSVLCQTNSQLSWLPVTVTKRRSVVVDEISPKSKRIKAQVFKKQFAIPNGDPR